MTIAYVERLSDSPYVDRVTHGHLVTAGTALRPAEAHWHMVFMRLNGSVHHMVVGPWSNAGPLPYGAGAEVTWIRFRLGTFMPHLPTNTFSNSETRLPAATGNRFWLKGAAWDMPTFENADTFADWLAREEMLAFDPVVQAALADRAPDISPRTLRHRFLRATGLTQSHIRQHIRAMQAADLLRQGTPILDTVAELGYFDQPHLTRALRHFTGYTPAQLLRLGQANVDTCSDTEIKTAVHEAQRLVS